MAESYRDLVVWQRAMDMVDMMYDITDALPQDERFALKSQMIRAGISVPANIAEGNRRGTRRDYAHFISVARGSLAELETYVLIMERRRYVPSEQCQQMMTTLEAIGRMLTRLRQSLLR
jgi:four helix bundle protein